MRLFVEDALGRDSRSIHAIPGIGLDQVREAAILPDGSGLVVARGLYGYDSELQVISLGGDAAARTLFSGYVTSVRVSPDGRLVAYTRRTPSLVDRVMVMSLDGQERVFVGEAMQGLRPVWAPDSSSLFYQTEERVMEAELTTSPSLQVVRQAPVVEGLGAVPIADVAPEGRSFLALTPVGASLGSEILVSVNWASQKLREWRER